MKLKQSIEKAKQQRLEAQKNAGDAAAYEKKTQTGVAGEADAFSAAKASAAREWDSPVYSQSKRIDLDPERLAENRIVSMFPDVPETEHYKVLRTNIQRRMRENNWSTLMVTSVQPSEGKTLTAINLAISFAKEFNQTVLLVDCDLRRQSIHRYLNYSSDKGIVDYLVDGCDLKDLIVWPNIEKLTLISGGQTAVDSSELIGSPKMKDLVDEIKHRYDDRYVIFDTPPVLSGADAIAFAQLADGIVMVVEEGRTSIKETSKALELLPAEKFLGFVLNRRKASVSRYYY